MQLRLPATTTRPDYVPLGGGLDLITPVLRLKPGYVRDALNFEQSVGGGYTSLTGYERFDGRDAPSNAVYLTLTAALTGSVSAGQILHGATSGATAVVLSSSLTTDGTVIAYTKQSAAFAMGELINVGGPSVGTVTALGGATADPEFDITQIALAADAQRATILPVPGSGPTRGGFYYREDVYAFRDNAGATALELYKATPTGWVKVSFGYEVAFTGGATAYTPGSTVTQGGVNATVRHAIVESGEWGAAATGRLIIDAPTGGSFASGAAVGAGAATLSGPQTAITLLPGGRVETDQGNFGPGIRVYGIDGVNRAWEFDGTTLAPITVEGEAGAPSAVLVHKDHLWLAWGDNVQASGITRPFNWTDVAGSIAFRMDSGVVTSMLRQPGSQQSGTMSVSTEGGTEMIYGNSAADFQKVAFEESAGSRKYGAQRLGGQTVAFGNIGVFSLSATQAFGNFTPSSMTMTIRPFVQVRKTKCRASLVNREKSQYRLFFSDGSGLYMTIVNGKLLGAMPVQFPHIPLCAWQGGSDDGNEASYFGDKDGFVYRLDSGTSFDGLEIPAWITLPFANQSAVRRLKRYRRATFECQGEGYAKFRMTYELDYGGTDRPQGTVPAEGTMALATVVWDGFTWDTFTWDGRNLSPITLGLDGTGENVAVRIDMSSAKYAPITFNSVVIDYSPRRALRGTT